MPPLLTVFGVPIFQNTSGWSLAFLVVLYLSAYTVKGVFGIGAMPLIVLLGAWVLEPHHAVLLGMLVLMYSQVMFVPESFRYGDWRLCGLLSIGYIPTVVLGVWIFDSLDQSWLSVILGILLICVTLADVIIQPQHIRNFSGRFPRSGAIVMAAFSGVISGIVGAGSLIFLSLYLKTFYGNARTFRATILLISVLVGIWRFAVQYVKGIITVSLVYESLVLVPAALLGTYLGMRLFRFMSSANYFRAFRVILILLAISIILRGMI